MQAEMPITLLEAYQGSQRTFELDGKKLRIKIKPGAYDGQQLRLKGKGQKAKGNGTAGDLLITLKLVQDNRFTRLHDNLKTTLSIDVYEALLGGHKTITTIDGKRVKINIPEGSHHGKIFRLKGKGMPNYRQPNQFGDLLVQLAVRMPKKISAQERKHLLKAKAANLGN